MGNVSRKPSVPDTETGLTPRQVKLVQSTWKSFCSSDHEYGVLLFLFMFAQHPEYLALFRAFRDKPLRVLKYDPVFRAHGWTIGYHLTSMVTSLEDAAVLKVLACRNAAKHLKRNGVVPDHFEVMGACIVDVMRAKVERQMTPEAVEAWCKFFAYLVAVIKDVYDEARCAEAGSTEGRRKAEASRDSGGSTAPASVTGNHAGSSRKQPYSTQEPVTERTECLAALRAADRPTAVSPIQDAATAPACKASLEKGTREEARPQERAQEKPAHQQDVHARSVHEKIVPDSAEKRKFPDMAPRKEQATS